MTQKNFVSCDTWEFFKWFLFYGFRILLPEIVTRLAIQNIEDISAWQALSSYEIGGRAQPSIIPRPIQWDYLFFITQSLAHRQTRTVQASKIVYIADGKFFMYGYLFQVALKDLPRQQYFRKQLLRSDLPF